MKKTTPKNLSKRLFNYSALSLSILGISELNGQIVYHPNVDISGPGDTTLNLNPIDGITPVGVADAIDDFRIFYSGSFPSAALIRVEVFNNNSINANSGGIGVYPYALGPGIAISNSNVYKWDSGQFQSLVVYDDCQYGYWCSATGMYLGLKFDINGNTHYGWAKLDVDAATMSWTLKEFAFNATPDEKIDTGQTAILSVEGSIFSKTKIAVLEKNISVKNLQGNTDYNLYSITGQRVLNGKMNQKEYSINGESLTSGLYILEIKDFSSGAILKKKILLK